MLNNPVNLNDPSGHVCVNGSGDNEVAMAGNCGGAPNPNYDGGLLGPEWNNNSGSTSSGGGETQTDMTEWLFEVLVPEAEYLKENYLCSYEYGYSGYHNCLLNSHQELFGNGKRYDIKLKMQNIHFNAVVFCGNKGCRWVDYSAPGNVLYGYLSASRGVSQRESWLAAGLRESLDNGFVNLAYLSSWLDNPGDKAAVDFGYSLYEKYGEDITFTDFQTSLSPDVLNSFQEPSVIPSAMPTSQENLYPPSFFLIP